MKSILQDFSEIHLYKIDPFIPNIFVTFLDSLSVLCLHFAKLSSVCHCATCSSFLLNRFEEKSKINTSFVDVWMTITWRTSTNHYLAPSAIYSYFFFCGNWRMQGAKGLKSSHWPYYYFFKKYFPLIFHVLFSTSSPSS